MARTTEYNVFLTEQDVVRCELNIMEGKVTALLLQYEADIGGTWTEVVRYDTSHGYLHRHRLWLPPPRQTDDLEDTEQPAKDYTDAFEVAKKDLVANWRTYRKAMEKERQAVSSTEDDREGGEQDDRKRT